MTSRPDDATVKGLCLDELLHRRGLAKSSKGLGISAVPGWMTRAETYRTPLVSSISVVNEPKTRALLYIMALHIHTIRLRPKAAL